VNSESIINKIKKLLSLSESSNKHEAERASAKAFELMARHDINIGSVSTEQSKIITKCIDNKRAYSFEYWEIASVLEEFFFVLLTTRRNIDGGRDLNFTGQVHRVEIAEHVFNFIHQAMLREWTVYRRNNPSQTRAIGNMRKRGFLMGFSEGIAAKLREKKEALQEEGLVLVNDPELEEFKSSCKLVAAEKTGSKQGYDAGLEKGLDTDIFQAIKNPTLSLGAKAEF
jgi:hypothetical protein